MARDGCLMLAELNGDAIVVAGDLGRCQGGDPGHGLAERQDQAPGDPGR